jgi:enolase
MKIKSISCRPILDSSVTFTNEFVIELDDGRIGTGSAPRGEPCTIYGAEGDVLDPETVVGALRRDGVLDAPQDQHTFDGYLWKHFSRIGRHNAFALSLAFFNARKGASPLPKVFEKPAGPLEAPMLCLSVLSGGSQARANAVLSDFAGYLLVSSTNDIRSIVEDYPRIQSRIEERFLDLEIVVAKDKPVRRFATEDNRECIDFILGVRNDLGLSDRYSLMIDASADDLRDGDGYRLSLTDKKWRTGEEFYTYWEGLVDQYGIGFLVEPFHQNDLADWTNITVSQLVCRVIAGPEYGSSVARIEEGEAEDRSHGVVVSPTLAGTVSAAKRAVETAEEHGLLIVVDEPAAESEARFFAEFTCTFGAHYARLGPLYTGYPSVMELNEIMRLTAGSRVSSAK